MEVIAPDGTTYGGFEMSEELARDAARVARQQHEAGSGGGAGGTVISRQATFVGSAE